MISSNIQLSESVFHSPTLGKLSFTRVVEEIATYTMEDIDLNYKVIVGSDSTAVSETSITTVIMVHRLSHGARYFYTKSARQSFPTLRDRIVAEALASMMLGQELRSQLKDELHAELFHHGIEIHVDIGTNGPTQEFIQTIIGMVRGYDFIPVIKPDSFAASTVADRHT